MVATQLSLAHLHVQADVSFDEPFLLLSAFRHIEAALLSSQHRESESLQIQLDSYLDCEEEEAQNAKTREWAEAVKLRVPGLVNALNATSLDRWTIKLEMCNLHQQSVQLDGLAGLCAMVSSLGRPSYSWKEQEYDHDFPEDVDRPLLVFLIAKTQS